MRVFSLLFLVSFSLGLSSQNEIKRIGIIPFERFSFESDHEIDTIASCNNLSNTDQVYKAYVDSLISHIADSSDLVFFILEETDLNKIHINLPKEYKYEPISHFGVDIKAIQDTGLLSNIAKRMQVDAFLFLTRYKIGFKLLTTRKAYGNSKYLSWSMHKIDYELYSLDGELIVLADMLELKPKNPNDQTYACRGTILNDMKKGFAYLGKDIEAKLERYSKKKKVIYKLKKK